MTQLLVPVHLDCLVVNEAMVSNHEHWRRPKANYGRLKKLESPAPGQGDEHAQLPSRGVYLHWALPDALTRSRQRDHGVGALEFPHVPNRWLVLRHCKQAPRPWKAWVVESDYLGKDGASPFVDPAGTDGTPPTSRQLGFIHEIHDLGKTGAWTDPGSPKKPFLRAVGPGDLTFAAWQPGVEGVFSLHDDLDGLTSENVVNLSYTVVGWGSDAAHDPLAGLDEKGFKKLMAEFRWSLEGFEESLPTTPPSALVCHGTRFNVRWEATGEPERPNLNPKQWTELDVGVGNTAIDGLAAILEARAREAEAGEGTGALVAELFEAVQYGALQTLDKPAGKVRLDHQIRDHWFGSHPGGVCWEIVAAEPSEGAKAPPPTLTAVQQEWLAKLNRHQRQLDAARRRLESLQSRLYARWWKRKKWPTYKSRERAQRARRPHLRELESSALKAVKAQEQVVVDLQNAVPDLEAAQRQLRADQAAADADRGNATKTPDAVAVEIAEWLAGENHELPPGLELKPLAASRFWHPTDPVVVVSGLARAQKHGEDGRLRPDGTLLCRLSMQAVTAVSGKDSGAEAGKIAAIPGIPNQKAVAAVVKEAFLLDPANGVTGAPALVVPPPRPGLTGAQRVEAENKAVAEWEEAWKKVKPGEAVWPSPIGVAAWKQAWVPLFLEWKVSHYATVSFYEKRPHFRFSRDHWRFSSRAAGHTTASGGPEYRYHDDNEDGWLPHAFVMSGRTFLTPQVEYKFVEQITKHLESHGEGASENKAADFVKKLSHIDVLSQTLSGFNERLIMRQPESNLPPGSDEVGKAIGDHYHAVPDPDANRGARIKRYRKYPFFLPVRGGFFAFDELEMVDAFGQKVDLLYGNNNVLASDHKEKSAPESFMPHRGRGMLPPATELRYLYREPKGKPPERRPLRSQGLVALPPRIVQAARLDFHLLDGRHPPLDKDKEAADYELVAGAEPICGWIVPNHFDKALSIYDSKGYLLGELIVRTLFGGSGGKTVDWLPAPNAQDPILDPRHEKDGIENRYLRGFVNSLLPAAGTKHGNPDAGRSLERLMEVIDSTMWTVDPLGRRSDQNLSVLIGRPLALARARLALTLRTDPVRDQTWIWDYEQSDPDNQKVPEKNRQAYLRMQTADFLDLEFDVKLGEPELRNDGLMGYYEDEDFSRFHAVHPPREDDDSSYVTPIEDGSYLRLKLHDDDQRVVTMLLDPRGAVHAATGLLPVKTLELPGQAVEDLVSGLRVTFRAGPLLGEPETVRLPRPAERQGTWGWLERSTPDATPDAWTEEPIIDLGHEARLADELPVLREGWLQLSKARPKLLYTVATDPEPLHASSAQATETAKLVFSVANASGDAVTDLSGIEFVVPLGEGPAALAVKMDADVVTAVGKPGVVDGVENPAAWKVAVKGDRVAATPPPAGIPDGSTFELTLSGLAVNSQPGTARIFVVEGTRGRPTVSLAVTKRPPGAASA